jgi:PAS domain S-box-containing protein
MATATAGHAVLPDEPKRLYAFLRRYPAIAGAVSACIGALVLAGWLANVHAITHPIHALPVTVANSAVMGMFAGVSLWLASRARWGRTARVASRIAAAPVALIAFGMLLEYVANVDLSIDRILADIEHAPWPSGRSSPYSASAYAAISVALLLGGRKTKRGKTIADYCALAAQTLAVTAVFGYLFQASALYETPSSFVGMSPTTIVLVLALSLGILALNVDDGMISIVLADDAGGVVARQLVLALLVFPPLAVIVIVGARLGWYALPLAAAITLLLALGETTVFTLRSARRLSRADAAQRQLIELERQSESRVRALVEEAKDGIFLADLDGRYIDVNPAACALAGYSRDELLGMTITDLLPPDELPRYADERANVVAGKTSRQEWRLRRRDGSIVEVEVVAHLLADRRWQAFVRDIGERKRYERAIAAALDTEHQLRADLQRAYAWLQAVLDQLPEGVMIVDDKAQVYAINRVLRQWAADPTVPDNAAFANPAMFDVRTASGDIVPFDELALPRALRGELIPDATYLMRQRDGSLLPIDARAAPIRDETGRPIGAVVIGRDASQRIEAERLREEWLAVVAHDLRQPVHTIVFSFDMLYEHASEQDRATLQRLRASAFHLNRMVDDLLDAARIAAGRLSVEPTYGDIGRIVDDEIERFRLTHAKADIHFDRPLEQVAWIDPERIHQVLGNLLSNAHKYRTPDTAVHVEITRVDSDVKVAVVNQGPTIPPEEIPRLFARFARTSSARGKRGIGLGLFICKALVEAHGGRIWAESAEGWTRFCFTVKVPELKRPARPQ